jgi:hypothetical protein
MRVMTKIIAPTAATSPPDLEALLRLIAREVVRKHLAATPCGTVTPKM